MVCKGGMAMYAILFKGSCMEFLRGDPTCLDLFFGEQ